MALSFSFNLSQGNASQHCNNTESAGTLASESAGSLAVINVTGGLIASSSHVDEFVSSNPFVPPVDYFQYSESAGSLAYESAGSLAYGSESAGSLAFGGESAGSLAFGGGCESAGSVASSGSDSFSSFC